jgi:hypothetical protein
MNNLAYQGHKFKENVKRSIPELLDKFQKILAVLPYSGDNITFILTLLGLMGNLCTHVEIRDYFASNPSQLLELVVQQIVSMFRTKPIV